MICIYNVFVVVVVGVWSWSSSVELSLTDGGGGRLCSNGWCLRWLCALNTYSDAAVGAGGMRPLFNN